MEESAFLDINLYGEGMLGDPLSLFFQEIALAVQIGPGEIWGVWFNVDIQKYIFNQYITVNQIRNEINSYIAENCEHASYFQFNTSAEIIKADNQEMIYINVTVNANGEELVQKFLLGQ